jgi:hypothetical protein
VEGSCEHGNERSDSIKGGEILDCLSDYYIFKKDSVYLHFLYEIFLYVNKYANNESPKELKGNQSSRVLNKSR